MEKLTKQQILSADDMKTEEVEVPEWGGTIIVKAMTGRERDLFDSQIFKADQAGEEPNIRAVLASTSVVDEKGMRLFTTPAEVEILGKKSSVALERVCDAARRLSGIGKEEVDTLGKKSRETKVEDSS